MADDILGIIRDRASAYGVDPAVLTSIARAESSLNPGDAASSSSAKGLFQFIDPTWKQYGAGGDPFDPRANADAGARFTRDNIAVLQRAGIEPTPAAAYLAHFAGPGTAVKLMTADPSTPVGSIMGEAAVRANPFLARMTVADLQNWSARKMGSPGAAPASAIASAMPASSAAPSALPGVAAPPAQQSEADDSSRMLLAQQLSETMQKNALPPLQPSAPMQWMQIPLTGAQRAALIAKVQARGTA